MVSHFCSSNNLLMAIFLLFFFFFLRTTLATSAGGHDENQLVELSNREDLIRLAGYGDRKLSTVLVTGTLLCKTCADENDGQYLDPRPVSGVLVAVLCWARSGKTRKLSKWGQGTTDEYGDFLIDLPSHIHAIPNLEKICLVKVLQLPNNSSCHPTYVHKGIKLSSIGEGIRTYTAQRIHLTPKPSFCTNDRKQKQK